MNLPHIIIVDDDEEICELLSTFLTQHHYAVTTFRDGNNLLASLKQGALPDLLILDVMLPGTDGFTLCHQVRSQFTTPIIMLTAMNSEIDRVAGLETGADDYLAKPFSPRELLARIKAILRRSRFSHNPTTPIPTTTAIPTHRLIQFSGWLLDPNRRRLRAPDGVIVELSAGEYDLLMAFIAHQGRILTREQLLDLTRERELIPFDRSIDVQVGRLRRKIEPDSKNPTMIKTIRGGGYQFTPKIEYMNDENLSA